MTLNLLYSGYIRDPHTNIGDSEHPGGTTSYCSAAAKTSDLQGELAPDFWQNVDYTTGEGVNGESYVQRMPPSSDLLFRIWLILE